MTPEQENAIALKFSHDFRDMDEYDAIRLAIRAAVAQERERIAQQWDGCLYDSVGEGEIDIAAAIRRGE